MHPLTEAAARAAPPVLTDSALQQLWHSAIAQGHRGVLVISGEQAACQSTAAAVVQCMDAVFEQTALGRQRQSVTTDEVIDSLLWVGQPPHMTLSHLHLHSLPAAHGNRFLGTEQQGLVYDAFTGLNPDSLAALAGTVSAGGLFLLLTPPLEEWQHFADPDYRRMLVYPQTETNVAGHFLHWLARSIRDNADLPVFRPAFADALIFSTATVSVIASARADRESAAGAAERVQQTDDNSGLALNLPACNRDQAQIISCLTGLAAPEASPMVLTADRGRGKSAALGLAAAQMIMQRLQQQESLRILVTAPRQRAVDTLFRHAHEQLLAYEQRLGRQSQNQERTLLNTPFEPLHLQLDVGGCRGALRFYAPDELLRQAPPAEVLLVDEAAAIPAPMLAQLMEQYPRIAFATTVHGYEGSGRGFEIRFARVLDRIAPGWHKLRLQAPVRWAEGDPLERWLFDALLMDAEPAAKEQLASLIADTTAQTTEGACRASNLDEAWLQPLGSAQLLDDPALLREVFALLLQAHYRTTPGDLRDLLDGNNLQTWVMRLQGQVLGVLLVALEGDFDAELAQQVWLGKRRPRGHLLPQTLSAQNGWRDSTRLKYSRVVRIAVHPLLQNRGLGTRMLQAYEQHLTGQGTVGFIGASYAASPDLMRFWLRAGYHCVRIGLNRDAASGCHSALVLKALQPQTEHYLTAIEQRFQLLLRRDLQSSLGELEPALVRLIKDEQARLPDNSTLSWQDYADLYTYIYGHRGFDQIHTVLQPWLKQRLQRDRAAQQCYDWSEAEQRLVLLKVVDNLPWEACVSELAADWPDSQTPGRKGLEQKLRTLLAAPFQQQLAESSLSLQDFSCPPTHTGCSDER